MKPSEMSNGAAKYARREIAPQHKFYAPTKPIAGQAASHSVIMSRKEAFRDWHSPTAAPVKADVVYHHGDVGDIIYGLPAMRFTGAKKLVLCPSHITRLRMTPETAESLRPLLESQSYIDQVVYQDAGEGFDLNQWRWRRFSAVYSLADRHLDIVNAPHYEREKPWISVEPNKVARIVMARSPRYHNPRMPWKKIVEKYGADAVFVGLPDEHKAFVEQFGHVPYIQTTNHLDLARVIAGADLFIGNQSTPMALAVAMGKRFIMEQAGQPNVNCHFDRPNAFYVVTGKEELPPLDMPPIQQIVVPQKKPCGCSRAVRTG